MLSVYDLYDLHAIFVNIRFSPCNEMNETVILKVIDVLKNRDSIIYGNKFRIAIQPINALYQNELYAFTSSENEHTYYPIGYLKDERIYTVLIKACEQLLIAVREKNEKKIYDLADCLHNLPIYILEKNYSIPKRYWIFEIGYYRRKWDKNFLIDEQKLFKSFKLFK